MINNSQAMRLFQRTWPLAALAYLIVVAFALPVYFSPAGMSIASTTFSLVSVLISFGLAVLLYWRGRNEPMALYFSYFLLLYGPMMGGPLELLASHYLGTSDLAIELQGLLFGTPLTILLVLFPNGRPDPPWSRRLIPISLVLLVAALIYIIVSDTLLFDSSNLIVGVLFVIPTLFALLAQVFRYRSLASSTERQQMKWAVYGILLYIGLTSLSSIPWMIIQNLPSGAPVPIWVTIATPVWWLLMSIIPVFFTLAILRAGLWNVDLVIRRTLTYSLLTAMLAAIYFGLVLVTQNTFVALTGQESQLAVVISTLAMAALFTPLRRRLQHLVDRRFFRQRYNAAQTLADFAEAVRDEIDVQDVESALLNAINDTMQPESVALWLRETGE